MLYWPCKLAKSGVFPWCYKLREIEYDAEPVYGGGSAEVYNSKYKDKKIYLKLFVCNRTLQKQQSDEILSLLVRCWNYTPKIAPIAKQSETSFKKWEFEIIDQKWQQKSDIRPLERSEAEKLNDHPLDYAYMEEILFWPVSE